MRTFVQLAFVIGLALYALASVAVPYWRRRRDPNVCVRCGHPKSEHHRGRVDITYELVRADENNCWSCPPHESRTWHAFARPKYETKLIDRIKRDSSDERDGPR